MTMDSMGRCVHCGGRIENSAGICYNERCFGNRVLARPFPELDRAAIERGGIRKAVEWLSNTTFIGIDFETLRHIIAALERHFLTDDQPEEKP